MDILLTDEETKKLDSVSPRFGKCPSPEVVAKAQLKKVVELIDRNSRELPHVTKTMDWLFWQTLKKEAGI